MSKTTIDEFEVAFKDELKSQEGAVMFKEKYYNKEWGHTIAKFFADWARNWCTENGNTVYDFWRRKYYDKCDDLNSMEAKYQDEFKRRTDLSEKCGMAELYLEDRIAFYEEKLKIAIEALTAISEDASESHSIFRSKDALDRIKNS